jgi:hypothetical protein
LLHRTRDDKEEKRVDIERPMEEQYYREIKGSVRKIQRQ